jgi:hypothetical protein
LYCSSLRLGEQIEIIGKSHAWKKLTELPAVQMGLGFYQMQAAMPNSVPAKIQGLLTDTQWQATRGLLADMFAHEVFFSTDQDTVKLLQVFQEISSAVRFGPALAQLSDPGLKAEPGKIQAKLILATLLEHIDAIKMPSFLLGFRVSDTQRAAQELKRWENQFRAAFDSCTAPNKGRLEQIKVGKAEFFTLTIDGRAVPWDQVPLEKLKEYEDNPGDVKKLVARLKQLTLVVALGLRDNYLLLSVGASTEGLAKLGSGKPLADRLELKPLAKFADRRLTHVSYLSTELVHVLASPQKSIDDMLGLAEQALPKSGLTAPQQERIKKDAAKLAEELEQYLPEPAAVSGFSFLTDTGTEGYEYSWGQPGQFDGSKPLSLLDHIGGSPLAAFVMRAKQSPSGYEFLAKWAPVILGYVEEFALPKVEEKDRPKAKEALAELRKIGTRLDKVNRDLLIPALADGQSGLVLDGQLRSKQFFAAMPESDKPLPMLEPALVIGVSDAAKLRKAVAEYAAVAEDSIAAFRRISENQIPEFQLPPPETSQTKAGDVFAYPLPSEWGLDEQLLPNAGLGEHVAVLSLNRKQTERLLTATPLKIDHILADRKKPLAATGYCHWAAFVDLLAPWIDYGAQQALAANPQLKDNPGQVKYVMDQVHTLLEVLKVVQTSSTEIYLEGQVMVQHGRTELEDVK